jgi:NodT family efflux transporter outer membrane factor (OMF) lipoprotein
LDIAQAEGQVARAEADLESRSRELARAGNTLRLLLGSELPADLPVALALDKQPVVIELPAGLPSELLINRPDIRQAEQNLVAANADIGAARAAFFPRLSLTGSMGYSSSEIRSLFDDGHSAWSFTPQLSLPLFQGGRLRAELNLTKVRTSSAVAEYERAIQIAFREVADGLAGRATYGREIAAQMRAVASAQRRAELSNLRYRAGVDGRLELLDAQRQLYAQQQGLLDLRRGEFSNAIALYKALGSGLSEGEIPD